MAIPKYETVMLPLLHLLKDGETRKFGEVVPILEDEFGLTQLEREQLIPSGRMTTFRSRVHWAAFYIARAELLERPQRGWLQITDRGKDVLVSNPAFLDNEFLNQFEEFREFRARSGVRARLPEGATELPSDSELNPEENLEISYQTLERFS